MRLPFLDRHEEKHRLLASLKQGQATLNCLYGRRRCGKSRLLVEVAADRPSVFYVGDDRDAPLQRRSLAAAIAELIDGFDRVEYPDWDALLDRWWREAPNGALLVLDEFPSMVGTAPALPSLLQKRFDQYAARPVHMILCGSSQRMMQGLVLDARAPLYGRAREIIEVAPLDVAWLSEAFAIDRPSDVLQSYAVWGGVPRYWELALDHPTHAEAVRALVFNPMGVLHREPERLLLDDMREITKAASILSLIGQGCHKPSEIAARLGHPATALARPLQRLQQLGMVRRDVPFGVAARDSKRSLYRISDPFLRFWFRYVEPNRSRLQAGHLPLVEEDVARSWPAFLGGTWEELVRDAVPKLTIGGTRWGAASRWWGTGTDRAPIEVDIVAESLDAKSLLVGEVKLSCAGPAAKQVSAALRRKIQSLSIFPDHRKVPVLFCLEDAPGENTGDVVRVSGRTILDAGRQ